MNSPAEKGSERKWRVFLEYYLTLNTLVQLPMQFICLIITAQFSNIKGFQIILREAAAADQCLFYKVRENTFGNKWSFLWKAAEGTIPKKEHHTLRLAACVLCSQKQIKTSDTERTLMTMITVVWGQTTNWSSFKDQVREMRHRSWITVVQHSPAQVLLPGFSSVYSLPTLSFLSLCKKGTGGLCKWALFLLQGWLQEVGCHQAAPARGRKGMSYWGSIRKLTHLRCPKVPYTEPSSHTSTSDHHSFTSRMFGWNTGKRFQQNLLEQHYQQWPHKGSTLTSKLGVLSSWPYGPTQAS